MKRGIVPLLLLVLPGCGDSAARFRIELDLQGTNPLAGLVTIRVTATGPDMDPVTSEGPLERRVVDLPEVPFGLDRVITVEGMDQDGVPVARGESAPFDLTSDSPETVTVPFARCTSVVYRDADGDGHGDSASGKTACVSSLSGYVDQKGDCDDADDQVYPGQTDYFDKPANSGGYDYDCNGMEEPEDDTVADCASQPSACKGEGWAGTSAPACGQTGTWVVCEKDISTCMDGPGTPRTQACR